MGWGGGPFLFLVLNEANISHFEFMFRMLRWPNFEFIFSWKVHDEKETGMMD